MTPRISLTELIALPESQQRQYDRCTYRGADFDLEWTDGIVWANGNSGGGKIEEFGYTLAELRKYLDEALADA